MSPTLHDLLTASPRQPMKPGEVDLSSAIAGLRQGRARPRTGAGADPRTGQLSLERFCTTYLAHHFTKPFGEPHRELFTTLEAPPPPHRGVRVARAEPRYFGKTTIISLAFVLWNLAYQKKHFVILIGESTAAAASNLQTLVHEIEENAALRRDFPLLVPKRDLKNQVIKWTDSAILLATGAMVLAKGMNARMRGLKQQQYRPDLGVIDDPESPETVGSFLTRARHKRWFGGTFLGLGGDAWDIYVIGNLVHHDGLLASLLKSPEWDSKLFRAVNAPRRDEERYPVGNTRQDGSAAWPEVWSLDRLDAYRREPTVGDLGFAREMMNDPREDKTKPFNVVNFTFIDWEPARLSEYTQICAFLDPAGGEKPNEMKKGKRDFAALVTAGSTKDGHVEVFDVVMNRALPDDQAGAVMDRYREYHHAAIGVEENMFKNLIGPTILRIGRERNLYPPLIEQTQIHNKVQRILATQPVVANGTVRFARHLLDSVPEYFGQWDDFPGDFDDGPDATEGVLRLIESMNSEGFPIGVGGTSYWRSSDVSHSDRR